MFIHLVRPLPVYPLHLTWFRSVVNLSQNEPQEWLFKMVYFWYHLVSMRIDWDDDKSDKLKRERGLSIEEVSVVIEGPHPVLRKTDIQSNTSLLGLRKTSSSQSFTKF